MMSSKEDGKTGGLKCSDFESEKGIQLTMIDSTDLCLQTAFSMNNAPLIPTPSVPSLKSQIKASLMTSCISQVMRTVPR